MRKAVSIVGFITISLVASVSSAGSWSDYAELFPLSPCQDGWLGCIVSGESHNSDLSKDSLGFPMSSADRVGWHDLEGTSVFSPFPRLSSYSGELATVVEVDEPEEDPVQDEVVADEWEDNSGSEDQNHDEPNHEGAVALNTPQGNNSADVLHKPTVDIKPETDSLPTEHSVPEIPDVPKKNTNSPVKDNAVQPILNTVVKPKGDVRPPVNDALADAQQLKAKPEGLGILKKTAVPTVADDTCEILTKLEPKAMLGRLTKGQAECLETRIGRESKQTSKDKISRILMANAYASGDKRTWEKLVQRHLDKIDQSDPDLCFKYARHLSKKGAGRAKGVIRWAQVALDNRFNWTGDTYKSRVYSLHKLKSQAAQRIWQTASEKYNGDPSPDNKAKMEKARNQTKTMARQWLDYAREAGKDHTKALQLCVSAAGTEDYCEGG